MKNYFIVVLWSDGITKTIQVRPTRHAGHCWRSRDKLISDVLLWTPTYGRAKAGRPTRTYIQQPCEDTGCSPEDVPEAMNDREKWREGVRDICAGGTTWWWWWLWSDSYNQRNSFIPGVVVTLNCIWWWGSSLEALGSVNKKKVKVKFPTQRLPFQ